MLQPIISNINSGKSTGDKDAMKAVVDLPFD